MTRKLLALVALSALASAACLGDNTSSPSEPTPEPSATPSATPEPTPQPTPNPVTGWVFALGNQDTGSEVVALQRGDDGSLVPMGTFPTGGLGSGGGLGSQSALALTPDGQYLYAVNAGSDQISAFRVYDDHLSLIDIADSGGIKPTSLTASNNRLYVLNADASGSVAGFAIEDGKLIPIAGASQPLSETANPTAPAQVGLSPDGGLLVVSEKATNRLTTYLVAADGTLSAPIVNASEGQTPFGFAFTPDGVLVVSEAFGGGAGAAAASSYVADAGGNLVPVSSSVGSGQSAACWIAIAGDGAYAYATNTGSNTVSGYDIAADGSLTLFGDAGVTMDLGSGNAPIDMAVSADGQYLYVLNAASDTVRGLRVDAVGNLAPVPVSISVPASAAGLAGL